MVAQIEQEVGPINILVNNAGITRDNLILRMTEEEFIQKAQILPARTSKI